MKVEGWIGNGVYDVSGRIFMTILDSSNWCQTILAVNSSKLATFRSIRKPGRNSLDICGTESLPWFVPGIIIIRVVPSSFFEEADRSSLMSLTVSFSINFHLEEVLRSQKIMVVACRSSCSDKSICTKVTALWNSLQMNQFPLHPPQITSPLCWQLGATLPRLLLWTGMFYHQYSPELRNHIISCFSLFVSLCISTASLVLKLHTQVHSHLVASCAFPYTSYLTHVGLKTSIFPILKFRRAVERFKA